MRKRSEINKETKWAKNSHCAVCCVMLCAVLYVRFTIFSALSFFCLGMCGHRAKQAHRVLFHLHCHVQHAPSTLNLVSYEQNEIFWSCKLQAMKEKMKKSKKHKMFIAHVASLCPYLFFFHFVRISRLLRFYVICLFAIPYSWERAAYNIHTNTPLN